MRRNKKREREREGGEGREIAREGGRKSTDIVCPCKGTVLMLNLYNNIMCTALCITLSAFP